MPLPRLHLFEWEDLQWFPHAIRDLALDYLGFLEIRFALYKPVLPLLRKMFEQTGQFRIVDLCAGRGELVLALYETFASEGINVAFTLTDKFPHLGAFRNISSQHPLYIRLFQIPLMPQKYRPSWLDCAPYSTPSITFRRGWQKRA